MATRLIVIALGLCLGCRPGGDAAVVGALGRAGADLRAPQTLDFVFVFDEASAADTVAAQLDGEGFATSVDDQDDGWTLVATRTMPIDTDRLEAYRRRFGTLAAAHGGIYRGWSAGVPGEAPSPTFRRR